MLEAIVALAIVGLVCVSVLGAFGATARADVVAAERLPLAALAVERLAVVDLSPAPFDQLPDSLARGSFDAPYATATWSVSTRRVPQREHLYSVDVTVRDGSDAFTLHTRRFRRPPPMVAR